MKKYLMIGFAALAFAACSSNSDDVFDPSRSSQGDKYASAFIKEFGEINSSVNWGFDTPQKANFDNEGKFTGFTRGVNANGNEWGLYVEVPQPLTEDQKTVVTNWFKANKNPQGVAVNWSDFFVQQVYKGEWGGNMNYLYCGSETDHTNNFNAGDGGVYGNVCYGLKPGATDQNDRLYGSDKIEFMVNSSTEYFGFHNSFDSNFYVDNYVIIPGDVIDSSVAGMYFVGFDFEANGQADNQKVARDFYFDNWIVKITPGLYKNAERVFVEDLIATKLEDVQSSDWDFNDAVFDVYFEKSYYPERKLDAVITLRAAGGILPLTVAGKEVHAMLKQPQDVMINTNAAAYGKAADGVAPAIFRVRLSDDPEAQFTANDIKVVVNGSTELKAVQGEATQKLCGPSSVDWCKEKVNIKNVQSNFVPYVKGSAPKWHNK